MSSATHEIKYAPEIRSWSEPQDAAERADAAAQRSEVFSMRNVGKALRRMRQLRGMKQLHLAELMGVTQSTISRWESGMLPMCQDGLAAVQKLLNATPEPEFDAVLERLIKTSTLRVHLVCDKTHQLLAASPARQREWRVDVVALRGQSMLAYASLEILEADKQLAARGWFEQQMSSLIIQTGSNSSDLVPISSGQFLWERIALSDGTFGCLVTTLA
jgi:transcriptional regulator with XRE-family HTH domain